MKPVNVKKMKKMHSDCMNCKDERWRHTPVLIQRTEYALTDDSFSEQEMLERDFFAYVKLAGSLQEQLKAVDATIQEILINYQISLDVFYH